MQAAIPIPTGEPVTGLGGSEAIAGSVTSEFPDGHQEAEQQTWLSEAAQGSLPNEDLLAAGGGYNFHHGLLDGYPADVRWMVVAYGD